MRARADPANENAPRTMPSTAHQSAQPPPKVKQCMHKRVAKLVVKEMPSARHSAHVCVHGEIAVFLHRFSNPLDFSSQEASRIECSAQIWPKVKTSSCGKVRVVKEGPCGRAWDLPHAV